MRFNNIFTSLLLTSRLIQTHPLNQQTCTNQNKNDKDDIEFEEECSRESNIIEGNPINNSFSINDLNITRAPAIQLPVSKDDLLLPYCLTALLTQNNMFTHTFNLAVRATMLTSSINEYLSIEKHENIQYKGNDLKQNILYQLLYKKNTGSKDQNLLRLALTLTSLNTIATHTKTESEQLEPNELILIGGVGVDHMDNIQDTGHDECSKKNTACSEAAIDIILKDKKVAIAENLPYHMIVMPSPAINKIHQTLSTKGIDTIHLTTSLREALICKAWYGGTIYMLPNELVPSYYESKNHPLFKSDKAVSYLQLSNLFNVIVDYVNLNETLYLLAGYILNMTPQEIYNSNHILLKFLQPGINIERFLSQVGIDFNRITQLRMFFEHMLSICNFESNNFHSRIKYSKFAVIPTNTNIKLDKTIEDLLSHYNLKY